MVVKKSQIKKKKKKKELKVLEKGERA